MPFTSTYDNVWVNVKAGLDPERTEDMLYGETQLALDMHNLERELRSKHGVNGWARPYLQTLEGWLKDELDLAYKARDRAVQKGDAQGEQQLLTLHAHRRYIACIAQDHDLISQAVKKSEEPTDYIDDAVSRRTAIIVGAS